MNFDHDSWDLRAEYTWLCMSESNSKTIPTANADQMSSNWHEGQTTYYAKGYWKLASHIVDIELGRWSQVGKKLTVRPHFGLRNYYMWHTYQATSRYSTTTTDLVAKAKQRDWALGARAGLDANWLLGCGFRLFGHAEGAILYQYNRATLKRDEYTTPASPLSIDINRINKIGYLTYNPEIGLGIAYGTYFCDKSWHFDMAIGYDFQAFTTQNYMRALSEKAPAYEQDIGDMFYQGLTITFRFDF
jgi:hypothetical protein